MLINLADIDYMKLSKINIYKPTDLEKIEKWTY